MTHTYVERVAKSVVLIEAAGTKRFPTTAIKYLAARSVFEAFRGQVHTPLSQMLCLKIIEKGGDNKSGTWEITEPPGHICYTCLIAPRPKQRSVCERRKQANLPVKWNASSKKMRW